MSSKYDWSQIKSALVEFAENLPVEFSSCVLIGGGAALAYRAALQSFNLAHLISANTNTEDFGWVLRDADFVSTEVGADEIAVVKLHQGSVRKARNLFHLSKRFQRSF